MAKYFGIVFTQEPLTNDEPGQSTKSQNRLFTVNFNQGEIVKALGALDTNKSTRSNEIHPKVLRQIVQYIGTPRTTTFNAPLSQDELHTDWKNTIVSMIYKTDPEKHLSNYRPVILTSVPVIILEVVVKKITTAFVVTKTLLNSGQNSFRKRLSFA